jgi:hypothetical protein
VSIDGSPSLRKWKIKKRSDPADVALRENKEAEQISAGLYFRENAGVARRPGMI